MPSLVVLPSLVVFAIAGCASKHSWLQPEALRAQSVDAGCTSTCFKAMLRWGLLTAGLLDDILDIHGEQATGGSELCATFA